MLLISSAQPCSSNSVWWLLCGNLADRDPSADTSERSASLSGTAIWELQVWNTSRTAAFHTECLDTCRTLSKDRRIFYLTPYSELSLSKLASRCSKSIHVLTPLLGKCAQTSSLVCVGLGTQQTSLQYIRQLLNMHVLRVPLLPCFCTFMQLHHNINEIPKTRLFSSGTLLHFSSTWDCGALIPKVSRHSRFYINSSVQPSQWQHLWILFVDLTLLHCMAVCKTFELHALVSLSLRQYTVFT